VVGRLGPRLELRIARRYLVARRKQAFISAISAVSVVGVAVGVMALVIALGLLTGLQREIRSKILGATSHLHVFKSRSMPFEDYREVAEVLRELPDVLGAAPALYGKGLISSSTGEAFATLKGILPEEEGAVSDLSSQLSAGRVASVSEDLGDGVPGILLGRGMAISLGVSVGDVVTLTTPRGRLSPLGLLPRQKRMRVVGTVRTGLYEFDTSWAWLSLSTAQDLAGVGDSASQVEMRVSDMYGVRKVAGSVLDRLGPGYMTTDWIEMNGPLFAALWLEKTAIALTIFLIVLVAALNIVATLILMVMEKHQDIAILVSMGASRSLITRIFMLQGTIIGTVGTSVGALCGVLACWVLDKYEVIRLPGDVYQVSHVPFVLLPTDLALVIFGALAICFVATIYPARGAMKLDPAEALRHE
jgi:lipoprotein-releasing system permease protein